jgi:alanyl-tRNA synthetase
MNLKDCRSAFIDWFEQNGHKVVKSSSLIPTNDPTLLFVNAGMVQFKDIFTGKRVVDYKLATTSQKCMRAGGKHNDLDNVGYTARHHTFFEMLGNFSFGGYFKDEAIRFAWEFLTQCICLSKDKLLVTVHSSDDESARIWKKVSGLHDSKIIRIATEDNFWSMGDDGPCGPCSEIFYDLGDAIPGGPPGTKDADGDRFVEIWNLVFMQFDKTTAGDLIPLPKPCIDTGMGIERFAAILQGVTNNYDIDLFKSLKKDIEAVAGKYQDSLSVPFNVISDHIRATAFLIADGVTPSNEGRGYVLRRIIRRSMRYGYSMGLKEPFLYKLIESVNRLMGESFPELLDSKAISVEILKNEECGFINTIDNGMQLLKSEIEKMGTSECFSANIAYKLHDTYGFPFDMTKDCLRSFGKTVSEDAFESIVTEQKAATKGLFCGSKSSVIAKIWYDASRRYSDMVRFERGKPDCNAEILLMVENNQLIDEAESSDADIFLVTNATPFYPESGGQVGDIGTIVSNRSDNDSRIEVIDTISLCGLIAHRCVVKHGSFKIGDDVRLAINWRRRFQISRNHTATHILHAVLRKVLGEHVCQKGSSVTEERLRFDFVHSGQINLDQLQFIENEVSKAIESDLPVHTKIMQLEDAKAAGAVALFGEKYPDVVRVVTIEMEKDEGYLSRELCCGEHVSRTSQIGCFKIAYHGSVGAGIRRIEAVTGIGLKQHLESQIDDLNKKYCALAEIIRKKEKENEELRIKRDVAEAKVTELKVGQLQFRSSILPNLNNKAALALIDLEKNESGQRCLLVIQQDHKLGKLNASLYFSKELSLTLDARSVLQSALRSVGDERAKSGGRADLAQAGGIPATVSPRLIQEVQNMVISATNSDIASYEA